MGGDGPLKMCERCAKEPGTLTARFIGHAEKLCAGCFEDIFMQMALQVANCREALQWGRGRR